MGSSKVSQDRLRQLPLKIWLQSAIISSIVILGLTSCERPDPQVTVVIPTISPEPTLQDSEPSRDNLIQSPPTPEIFPSPTTLPEYFGTPTPDPTRILAEGEANYLSHNVSIGESLTQIAQLYGSTVEELLTINNLDDGDILAVDQVILVPAGNNIVSPNFKIIPDSELVYGPGVQGFDVESFVAQSGGHLQNYQEEVEGQILSGPAIVQLVADRYSLNPRLLLALLEHYSGWVTQPSGNDTLFPMNYVKQGYEGLYKQLGWAANLSNFGFYGRSEGGLTGFEVADGTPVTFASGINDGTAGIQLLLAATPEITYDNWLEAVGPTGFAAVYNSLYGNPFAYTVDPLWPTDLSQPSMGLPWPSGETWYFTSGPHGGWASGSAWAALDFSPLDEELGCNNSQDWITAMADGLVTRSEMGAVETDLDGDGFAGTGWVILYMHVGSMDRIEEDTFVDSGDRLGHASCEGGFANWAHIHIARKYNGRWVSADGPLPFELNGWVTQGLGREYDGLLVRDDVVKEACECREEWSAITAD
jgi:LysM repeat protein